MQLSKACMVADHYPKAIEYVCMYSQCQLSRFLCSNCLEENIHKHNQSDNSHILKNMDFSEKIKNKLEQAKGNQQQEKYDIEKSIVPLKQLMSEIQNLFMNIQNIIQQVEQGQLQRNNIKHLEKLLLSIQQYGFNQIDDCLLNNLVSNSDQQQDFEIYKDLEDQVNQIIQNALKIKEWRFSQVENIQLSQLQKIKYAKYQIQQIDSTGYDEEIRTGAISNDLNYIVSGGDVNLLKIWDYQSKKLIKSIELNHYVISSKFTDDSTLLYAGSLNYLYQFDANNQFKELYKKKIHNSFITCIYCITNTIILTSSNDKTIIKLDVDKKQQLLKIQAHNDCINGLDYNKSRNLIVSGSYDKSIKLWDGNDGSLIIEKLNAHYNDQSIKQVLFIINNNQLISLDLQTNLVIWNINYQTRQLQQLQLIKDSGENISLVLQQQHIIATGKKSIKVYSKKGDFVRQFDHEVDDLYFHFNTIQIDSMKAALIQGRKKLLICKFYMD